MVATNIAEQGVKNREYVRRMLRQKQPAFAEALELAVELVGRAQNAAPCPRFSALMASSRAAGGRCLLREVTTVRRRRGG
jgi:hypothetical protein